MILQIKIKRWSIEHKILKRPKQWVFVTGGFAYFRDVRAVRTRRSLGHVTSALEGTSRHCPLTSQLLSHFGLTIPLLSTHSFKKREFLIIIVICALKIIYK